MYEKGWGGDLVEPSPTQYKSIARHYANDPKVTVHNIAIGTETGWIDFYVCEDAVSTSNVEHKNKWEAAGVAYRKMNVPQCSIVPFMEANARDCDFLSIDTEATNIELFRAIPDWVFEQIKMICIEHDLHYEEIQARLSRFGFNVLHLNAENIILAK